MIFEWDEGKRRSNIETHGLDFTDAALVLQGPTLRVLATAVDAEERWLVLGLLEFVVIAVIYTLRGDAVRIISMRRARHGERRAYREAFGGGVK